MKYGHIDFARINTDPGSGSVFAPPADWSGDYFSLMRQRYCDLGMRGHLVMVGRIIAKAIHPVEFIGPYAAQAEQIATSVWKQ